MLIELPIALLVTINVVAWPLIHLGVSWLVTRMPPERFSAASPLYRVRGFEQGGELYQRLLRVRSWKRWLPDGAALFARGFRKKRLTSRDPAYLHRFAAETCRAELAHWVTMAFGPLFILFNPPWAAAVMCGYAVVANLPFIVAQRHNRARLLALLARQLARRTDRRAQEVKNPPLITAA